MPCSAQLPTDVFQMPPQRQAATLCVKFELYPDSLQGRVKHWWFKTPCVILIEMQCQLNLAVDEFSGGASSTDNPVQNIL